MGNPLKRRANRPSKASEGKSPAASAIPSPLGQRWQQRPGGAVDIGVGADGSTWICGTDAGIHKWTAGGWQKIDGTAARICVGTDGLPCIINHAGQIFQRLSTNRWKKIQWVALDVSIASDGTLWICGPDAGIYKWSAYGWWQIDGEATRIAVGPEGLPWVVNDAGQIFQCLGGTHWKQKPGLAVDIGIGSEGSVWICAKDSGIYRWTGETWQQIDGSGTRISVAPDGLPWVLHQSGAIFQRV